MMFGVTFLPDFTVFSYGYHTAIYVHIGVDREGQPTWKLVSDNPELGDTGPIDPRLQRLPDGRLKHPELTPANPETSGPIVPDGPGPAADSGGKRGFG
jgi:hypothetical protein